MRNLSLLTIVVFLTFIPSATGQFAEVPPPDTGDSGAGFDDDIDDELIPINGLIAVGLMFGAIYGIRKSK